MQSFIMLYQVVHMPLDFERLMLSGEGGGPALHSENDTKRIHTLCGPSAGRPDVRAGGTTVTSVLKFKALILIQELIEVVMELQKS